MVEVITGHRYRARVRLGVFEQVASNSTIAGRFSAAGMSDVVVTGYGRDRIAEGTWPGPSTNADLPSQIQSVEVIP